MQYFWLILRNGFSRSTFWCTIVIVLLVIISVISIILTNMCYKWFYDSLVAKDLTSSVRYILIYSGILVVGAICESEIHYRKRLFTMLMRVNLYHYYSVHALDEERCPFSCQKMSQDLFQFGNQLITIFTELLHSVLLIPSFLYILYQGIGIWVILLCCFISLIFSYISKLVGKPVVRYQYNQESLEGALRRRLIEQIEKPRKDQILPDISYSQNNFVLLIKYERILIYLKKIYDRIAHSIPYVITMPKYFAGKMTLGSMVQTGTALSRLITEVSFFINNIDKIVEITATLQRIKDLEYARQYNLSNLLDNKID